MLPSCIFRPAHVLEAHKEVEVAAALTRAPGKGNYFCFPRAATVGFEAATPGDGGNSAVRASGGGWWGLATRHSNSTAGWDTRCVEGQPQMTMEGNGEPETEMFCWSNKSTTRRSHAAGAGGHHLSSWCVCRTSELLKCFRSDPVIPTIQSREVPAPKRYTFGP